MINVQKVQNYILQDVAQNLGWDGDGEIPQEYLERISKMSPEYATQCFCAWHLGSREWGRVIVDVVDSLRESAA